MPLKSKKMKKVIGVCGIAVLAATMFINTTNVSESGDVTLDAIIGLASANAENCVYVYNRCDAAYPSSFHHFDACMYGGGC